MRKTIGGLVTVAVCLGLAACGAGNSGNQQESRQQRRDSQNLIQNQPVPGYNYSQIRQNLIEIENSQAQGVQTTSFFFNQGVRNPVQSCPSIGSPIPTTTQLTNPNQVIDDPFASSGGAVVGQMDPNGVYSGNSSGTYVICIDPSGKPYADYWEGFVQTVYGPAVWDSSAGQVRLIGPPSFHFSGKR